MYYRILTGIGLTLVGVIGFVMLTERDESVIDVSSNKKTYYENERRDDAQTNVQIEIEEEEYEVKKNSASVLIRKKKRSKDTEYVVYDRLKQYRVELIDNEKQSFSMTGAEVYMAKIGKSRLYLKIPKGVEPDRLKLKITRLASHETKVLELPRVWEINTKDAFAPVVKIDFENGISDFEMPEAIDTNFPQ